VRALHPTDVNTRRLAIVLAVAAISIWQCGCTREENDQAKRKLHEAGQELKQETKDATKKLKEGADKAARELRSDAHEASQKMKKGGEKLKHEGDSK
jgi:hypothetical protein